MILLEMAYTAINPNNWCYCQWKYSECTYTVECGSNIVQDNMILHVIAGTEAEYQSAPTKDTTYLALTGELCGVFCEYFGRNLTFITA